MGHYTKVLWLYDNRDEARTEGLLSLLDYSLSDPDGTSLMTGLLDRFGQQGSIGTRRGLLGSSRDDSMRRQFVGLDAEEPAIPLFPHSTEEEPYHDFHR